MASYQNITNTLDFAVSFKPSSAFPLDARSMFGSLSAAQAAAATAVNAGGTDSIYYFGQILTVFDNDVATHYSIQGDRTLKEVGKATVGDNKTIVLKDTVLGLKGFGEEYYAYREPDETHPSAYYELTQGWKAGLEPKVVSTGDNEFALAWYEPSTTTVEGLQSAIGSLQTETEAVKGRVDTLEASTAANTTAIETLNGDETTEGSVKKQVADAIAAVVADAPESLDTLKEISDWISSHAESAAAMNSSIQANTTAINALETLVGTLPEGAQATTVIGYIAEAIATEFAKLGTAAYKNVEFFATAEQGSKAESAVQAVTAGSTNGHISVDGTDVKVYEAPVATNAAVGDVKPDGTSINVAADGTISVAAVDKSKVTGLQDAIDTAKQEAIEAAASAAGEAYVAKTSVVASGSVAADVETASDTKVISEKAFMQAFTWKESM